MKKRNGKLTKAGKKALNEFAETHSTKFNSIKREGISLIQEYIAKGGQFLYEDGKFLSMDGDDYILSKKADIHRVANSDEIIDDKPKYVSFDRGDARDYVSHYDSLGANLNKSISEFIYSPTKDIRIANADKVLNSLLDRSSEEVRNNYRIGNIRPEDINGTENEWMRKHISRANYSANDALNTLLRKNAIDIAKEFASKGYDALIDYEDIGFATMPLILTNPKQTIVNKKRKEIAEGYDDDDDDDWW